MPLQPRQLGTYFALIEAVNLFQHAVEQQLRADGDLSDIQFQLLMRLIGANGQLTMTELADSVVYSRSGLTYQAGQLEKAGLVTRAPDPRDDRATLVTITDAGRARIDQVLPGHVDVAQRLLFAQLTDDDVDALGEIMTRIRDHLRAEPPRSAAPRKSAPRKRNPE
ncbi:MarR family winged helix-turn-helix transcriptional regulator [Actinoplanes solisilvae]|uniref:MarR family winged helix-turn-helix transcriptional regulator n=1 Tax=Actinoplanes solisilvae TaxID=2486853 RepID=UPI000FD8C217|nr:MarR family transcriptional regulator [Actinoplanes solisilvae]